MTDVTGMNRSIVCILLALSFVKDGTSTCASPQFLELGESGTIICPPEIEFTSVFWYNSSHTTIQYSIIDLTETGKSGPGITSGEYDIDPKGWLIIDKVSLNHEHLFTVVVFQADGKIPLIYHIDVIVVMTPSPAYPFISCCNTNEEICFRNGNSETRITCYINESKPIISAEWFYRAIHEEKHIPGRRAANESSSEITAYFPDSSIISILVCRASNNHLLLTRNETVLLIKNDQVTIPSEERKRLFVEKGQGVTMKCSHDAIFSLIWEKGNLTTELEPIAIGIPAEENLRKVYGDEYTLDKAGSLYLGTTDLRHEGQYACTYRTSVGERKTTTQLTPYALPKPAYPLFEGCDGRQSCEIIQEFSHNLSCALYEVYPSVDLIWIVVDSTKQHLISISNNKSVSLSDGELYNIFLEATYTSITDEHILIECKCVGSPLAERINKSEITIHFKRRLIKEVHRNVLIAMIPVSVVVVLLVVACCLCSRRMKDRISTRSLRQTNYEEDVALMGIAVQPIEGSSKKTLKKNLGLSYLADCRVISARTATNVTLPLESIYIRGKIAKLITTGNELIGKWKQIDMHGLMDELDSSKRIVLEADVGQGKSLLTLNLAREWIINPKDSFLKKIDFLFLLKLRSVQINESVEEAIKNTFFKTMNRQNLNKIFENNAVFLMLDGYDECSHTTKSSIDNFLAKKIYPKLKIMVTTRINALPKNFTKLSTRLKLTGFDDEIKDEYLKRTGLSSENITVLNRISYASPSLNDFLDVPLFFTSFVHYLNQEGQKTFEMRLTLSILFDHIVQTLFTHFHDESGEILYTVKHGKDFEHLGKFLLTGFEKSEIVTIPSCVDDDTTKSIIMLFHDLGVLYSDKNDLHLQDSGLKFRYNDVVFKQWIAAKALVSNIKSVDDAGAKDVPAMLENFDHRKFFFLYVFACGLNKNVGSHITSYLESVNCSKEFILLCKLEESTIDDDVLVDLEEYCQNEVYITDEQDEEHMARVNILLIASLEKIGISHLLLKDSWFPESTGGSWLSLSLKSGMRLPVLPNLKQLSIEHDGTNINEEELIPLIKYSWKCTALTTLRISNCLLPFIVHLPEDLESDDVHVSLSWFPSVLLYNLDMSSGKWVDTNTRKEIDYAGYIKEALVFGINIPKGKSDTSTSQH